jgi:hypothetical protein
MARGKKSTKKATYPFLLKNEEDKLLENCNVLELKYLNLREFLRLPVLPLANKSLPAFLLLIFHKTSLSFQGVHTSPSSLRDPTE